MVSIANVVSQYYQEYDKIMEGDECLKKINNKIMELENFRKLYSAYMTLDSDVRNDDNDELEYLSWRLDELKEKRFKKLRDKFLNEQKNKLKIYTNNINIFIEDMEKIIDEV